MSEQSSKTLTVLGETGCKGCQELDGGRAARMSALASEFRDIVSRSIANSENASEKRSWPERLHEQRSLEPGKSIDELSGEDNRFLAGESVEYSLSLSDAIPLGDELSCHAIDGNFLWVSTLEASFIVLSEHENWLFSKLAEGETPSAVTSFFASARNTSWDHAWEDVASLIGRLASSGLIKGISGNTDCQIPTPERFARFHLTKACQLACIHCYAESSPRIDRSNEMPTDRWGKLTRDFATNGGEHLLFTGGEALMHSGCIDLMRLGHSLGLSVTLFTNGLLVPRFIGDLRQFAGKVQVSLDGPDAETNDAIRGKNVYKRAVNAIDMLLEAGVPTRVGMTVMEQNWEAWKNSFSTFAERYADSPLEFSLSYGINTYGRAKNMTEVDVNVTRPTVDALMGKVNGHTGPKLMRAQSGCGYGEQLVVGPDGTVYPCHLLDAPICHIEDYDISKLMSIITNLTRLVDVDHVDGCKECDIRYLCGGTCRVIDGQTRGSRFVTTCTPEVRNRKYEAFVEHFGRQV